MHRQAGQCYSYRVLAYSPLMSWCCTCRADISAYLSSIKNIEYCPKSYHLVYIVTQLKTQLKCCIIGRHQVQHLILHVCRRLMCRSSMDKRDCPCNHPKIGPAQSNCIETCSMHVWSSPPSSLCVIMIYNSYLVNEYFTCLFQAYFAMQLYLTHLSVL